MFCRKRLLKLTEQIEKIDEQMERFQKLFTDKLDEVENSIQNSKEKDRETHQFYYRDLKDYLYDVEQRILTVEKRTRINELRQRKKALIVGAAEHMNIGDAAITLAEQKIIFEQYPEYFQVEFSTYEMDETKYSFLQAIVNCDDIIFINGGGNLGNRYMAEEQLRRRVIKDFPDNRIVILPQTIYFERTPEGKRQLEISKRIYNHHKDLTLFVRGKESLEFAKTHFINSRVFLMPDTAFALRRDYGYEREGILLCMRADLEKKLDQDQSEKIYEIVSKYPGNHEYRTNMAAKNIYREIRASVVYEELERYARHQVVITDRLHGMIFSAIMNTPVVVLKSADHKIQEFYEAFFSDANAVFYIGDRLEDLESAIQKAMTVKEARYPVLEKKSITDIRSFIEGTFV